MRRAVASPAAWPWVACVPCFAKGFGPFEADQGIRRLGGLS
ncbi:hypothetical protein MBELCI_3378 [Limimaricola cinnabarinus LL-001]|uniref:Uncharacterized protein n=1 Tax=Limimaricola cinnabarinus LL-001 TaxID=1337093 RepID=U2YPM5_9RHOB|nr:hypothetical protein MBELCI_3378 [Limimaricola cinnabarinus LL-001]